MVGRIQEIRRDVLIRNIVISVLQAQSQVKLFNERVAFNRSANTVFKMRYPPVYSDRQSVVPRDYLLTETRTSPIP